jgi:hypothetical protein
MMENGHSARVKALLGSALICLWAALHSANAYAQTSSWQRFWGVVLPDGMEARPYAIYKIDNDINVILEHSANKKRFAYQLGNNSVEEIDINQYLTNNKNNKIEYSENISLNGFKFYSQNYRVNANML